jgi:hypothetical protein
MSACVVRVRTRCGVPDDDLCSSRTAVRRSVRACVRSSERAGARASGACACVCDARVSRWRAIARYSRCPEGPPSHVSILQLFNQ